MSRIDFCNVHLRYPVRENQGLSLKEYLCRGLFRRTLAGKPCVEALSDVSFQIRRGERVGIIGHNGAGKSTLLRTIAGVYPISSGSRRVDGSICSLFEIQVGFHPDASGWENILFRSYLHGESPQTIRRRIHDIAEFSELGEFLDLPIRTYSAGMTMRLAFAIATSSEPDILLIDEVFSTGDLAFQKKAEQRMRELLERANIVVLAGHDLAFLLQFCNRIMWLENGRLRSDDVPYEVIAEYTNEVTGQAAVAV